MFKKKKSTVITPAPTVKNETNLELSTLIDKLQKTADKVEKHITDVEENLKTDVAKINAGEQALYQGITNQKILSALELLGTLDEDVVNAKRLKHPQSEMIEQDMKLLRERVTTLQADHKKIYHLSRSKGMPSVNWDEIMAEKLKNLTNKGYGQDLTSVESEVEEHNIFHSEVEALAPHISAGADQDTIQKLKAQHSKLLDSSSARQQNLLSLRDFMQRCTNELFWMDQQADERCNYDWSDTNLDYPARQKQYENFIAKCLEPKESNITKLNEDGQRLIDANHPAKNVIEAHMEAVHADWKEYLNLLICEENHLKHMADYHKFHKDARDTQDLLKRLDTEVNQKYNPEFKDVYQLEILLADLDDQTKAVAHFDEQVKALQKRSLQMFPLKYRRETPQKQLPVEAVCDYTSEEGQITRAERYTLLRNNGSKWDVKDAAGHKITAPGVCFVIPPTDPEAVAISDNLTSQQKGLKRKMMGSKTTLQHKHDELKKASNSATASEKDEQQCRQLMAGLDKVINDLDKQEKAIYVQLRPPLEQSRALQECSERLQKTRDIAGALSEIEPLKKSKVEEAKRLLDSHPKCASSSQLHNKVDETNKKHTKVLDLLQATQEKRLGAQKLEASIKDGKDLLSAYENKLAKEEVAPHDLTSLDKTIRELADMEVDLRSKKSVISDTEQNLYKVKSNCDNLALKFQEHCPDIERQEAEVQKLSKRYNNLNRQIEARTRSLQKAKTSYKNFRNEYDGLNTWLSRVEKNEPRETDDVQKLNVKLQKQRDLLSEIKRKETDLNNVSTNAQLYQRAVKDYETETEKFRSILDLEDGLVTQSYKRSRLESPAQIVKGQEAAIEAQFTEVNAVNKQRLENLEFAKLLKSQSVEAPITNSYVEVDNAEMRQDSWRIKQKLEDEIQTRKQIEKDIEIIQTEIYKLEGQTPKDTIITEEHIRSVPDPKLEEELNRVQHDLSEERRLTNALESDLEVLKLKLYGLETEVKEGAQQYTVKEVLRIERDRGQEEELRELREQLEDLKRKKMLKDNELIEIQNRLTILSEEKNRVIEEIIEEEVIQVKNDPELEAEYRRLVTTKHEETEKRKTLEDELALLQEKLRKLEKEKSIAEEKISVTEVLKIEKDVALEREVENLRSQNEEAKSTRRSSMRQKSELERKIQLLEEEKSKVIIQEKVREIVRPDPKAEHEAANLRLELVEQQRRYKDAELQLGTLQEELEYLRNRGPQVEVREVIKEVVKYKTDPETQKELDRLRDEIVDKTHETERSEMQIRQLRNEIEKWKETKPEVKIKEVINEVIQYKEDPNTKLEIDNLKIKLGEEHRKRLELEAERAAEEEKIRLRKLDLSQVREKVVVEEVVVTEEDPVLKSECNNFLQSIRKEQEQKEKLRFELIQLQKQIADLDLQLEELERERRARREAELEIQRLRVRLNDLEIRDKENRERVTVKQKVVLQQDPQQEKEHSILKLQLEEERHKRTLLENEMSSLLHQQMTLEKMDVKEKVIRTETVVTERDPEAEIEIQQLKTTLDEEKRTRAELEKRIASLTAELSSMQFDSTKSSKDMSHVRDEIDRLQRENQRLQNEIRKLQSEINITTTQIEVVSQSVPGNDGKDLEIRLNSLHRELEDLRKVSDDKEEEIEKLKKSLAAVKKTRGQRENHLRRSIVIIDPDSGKEMRPEDAYKLGLIDWKMFVNLQSQECDWEEITVMGPSGESSVLHDRKSGKKFSIDDALRLGHISKSQLQQYMNKEITIQEFGAMVSGKN